MSLPDKARDKFFKILGAALLIEVILAGVFLFLLFWIILPLAEEFESVVSEIALAESRITAYEREIEPLLEKNKETIQKADGLLLAPAPQDSIAFVEFLESVIRRNHLKHQLKTAPPSVQLHIDGNFSDIAAFIKDIENERFLMTIQNVFVTQTSADLQLEIAVL